ncbi:MAG: phenylacetate--CoA ligase [Euryarchaeota archaeon]|nr:phenylacetate--CoA ligase [Euryarchaeota archaeon]
MSLLQRLKISIARRRLTSRKLRGETSNPLEEWIHYKIRAEFKASPQFRQALGRDELGEIGREEVKAFQLHRFRQQMAYAMENAPYYRKKFAEAGIRPEDIRTWEDLEKVPLTEPSDLAAEPFTFLCVSQSKIMRAFTTSGTSGMRKRLFYTQNDVLNIIDSIAAALKSVGMTEEDTLQIMFPAVSAWDPGLMLDGACKVAGMSSVICSSVDVDEQIRTMRENDTRFMIGLTSFLYRVTMLAKDRYDLRSLGMKAIICSAEPLPEAMRREMQSAWGCMIINQFGMTEMGLATSIECEAADGMHINDADFLAEVIGPDGKHLDDRQQGELIFTSLSMEGSPLLRYRTYDLSSLIEPPCSCDFRTIGRMGRVQGRLDAQTKIGYGQKIYPVLFDEALLSISGVLSYHLILEKKGYRDLLTFKVEYKGDPEVGKEAIYDALVQLDEIKDALDNDLILPPVVQLVEAGSVEFAPKSKVIEDRRKNYDAPEKTS